MKHTASVLWEKKPGEIFVDNKYSRRHNWEFDGGLRVPASSSPHIVPLPYSDELAIDPEEAFVASISACHMLFFLSIAASHHFLVEKYEDHAEGLMMVSEEGKTSVKSVTLSPKIIFSGTNIPSEDQVKHMHHLAHEKCFIANSIKTIVEVKLEETV